jgi:hypothetical protein
VSHETYRRITWAHRLLVWPVLFLCVIAPLMIYEQQIRDMIRPPPFEALSARGEMQPNGLWRVTFRFVVREQCGAVTWRKVFRLDGGDDLLIDAVNASRPAARGAVIAGGSSKPGPLEFWLDYEPLSGRHGAFIVTGAFSDCPSGYQSVLALPPVPVDWTGVRP